MMQFTLRQLLDDPPTAQLLTPEDSFRLKTDLAHLIGHEHILTKHIQECQTALQFGNHPDTEITRIRNVISQHQTTLQQLHALYNHLHNHSDLPPNLRQPSPVWQ